MIKKLVLALILLPLLANRAEGSVQTIRFVEAKSIKELSGLPPQVEMTMEIMCNEELVQVVRYESVDPKSKITTIAVGALFKENLLSSCAGVKKDIKVSAGGVFSGRQYELLRIKK